MSDINDQEIKIRMEKLIDKIDKKINYDDHNLSTIKTEKTEKIEDDKKTEKIELISALNYDSLMLKFIVPGAKKEDLIVKLEDGSEKELNQDLVNIIVHRKPLSDLLDYNNSKYKETITGNIYISKNYFNFNEISTNLENGLLTISIKKIDPHSISFNRDCIFL